MTSRILSIIERGQRRENVRHDLSFESDDDSSADDILELKHQPPFIIETKPEESRADVFHAVLARHRRRHLTGAL